MVLQVAYLMGGFPYNLNKSTKNSIYKYLLYAPKLHARTSNMGGASGIHLYPKEF